MGGTVSKARGRHKRQGARANGASPEILEGRSCVEAGFALRVETDRARPHGMPAAGRAAVKLSAPRSPARAFGYARAAFPRSVAALADFVRIPTVSADPAHRGD